MSTTVTYCPICNAATTRDIDHEKLKNTIIPIHLKKSHEDTFKSMKVPERKAWETNAFNLFISNLETPEPEVETITNVSETEKRLGNAQQVLGLLSAMGIEDTLLIFNTYVQILASSDTELASTFLTDLFVSAGDTVVVNAVNKFAGVNDYLPLKKKDANFHKKKKVSGDSGTPPKKKRNNYKKPKAPENEVNDA